MKPLKCESLWWWEAELKLKRKCKSLKGAWRQWWWDTGLKFKGIRCFLLGHDEMAGCYCDHEDDYCDYCLTDWPQDKMTVPKLLNAGYSWLVERDWKWFDNLDFWLFIHCRDYLPAWWYY